jgi:serpin B
VAGATEDRIPSLLAQGTITRDTVAVLVNAIYFNAAWATQFRPADTQPRPFTLLDGSPVTVPTMHAGDLPARAAQVDGVAVVELPYDGDELSMLLLVPPVGAFARFEAALTGERLAALVGALEPQHLSLSMPRLEVRTSASLAGPLSALGLGIAFTDAADFSRISSAGGLLITDVVHEAFVKVDERGTEAAAATAVIVGTTSVPQIRPVAVDRPFLFLVRDHATGAVVFLGRVVAP